jgi:DNA-binding MarR family transcriptional regulator
LIYTEPVTRPQPDTTSQSWRLGAAVRSLLRAGRGMQSAMARHLGLGETDLAAMDELVTSPTPLGPVELGNRLGIRSASATVLVDRLEAAGHLSRHRHERDRRRVLLQASDSAIGEVGAMLAPLLVAMGRIADRLDPDSAELVLAFLRDVTAAMEQFAKATAEGDAGHGERPAFRRAEQSTE